MSEAVSGPKEGEILAGKYRVDRVLGVGGMGVVLAAHHLGLDTKVAVKTLLPEMLAQQELVARFAREARAAARITNMHVARVFDVGALENGAPYMVMELLEGSDLRQWLAERGPLPVPQAVDFLLQASEAVAEAHGLGIVHRDLKPANLFCVSRPDGSLCIKVLDFGISKVLGMGGSSSRFAMTSTSAVMGTPFYMSPEQMESARSVDGRSDIWALGVILFELLTAQVPFGGETLPEVCIKIATHAPPAVRGVRPDVPPGIEAAILRCLEKDRNKRFATIAELAAALEPFAAHPPPLSAERFQHMPQFASNVAQAPTAVQPVEARHEASARLAESLSAVGHTQAHVARRRKAVAGLVGAGVVLMAIAIAVALAAGLRVTGPASDTPASVRVLSDPAPASPAPPIPTPVGPTLAPPRESAFVPDLPADATRSVATVAPVASQASPPAAPVTPKPPPRPTRVSGAEPTAAGQPPATRTPALRPKAEPDNSANAFDERL